MKPSAPGTPVEFADLLSGLDVPPALAASINRHLAHLEGLTASLGASGMSATQIEASVQTLMASYRAELIPVLKSLTKVEPDAN